MKTLIPIPSRDDVFLFDSLIEDVSFYKEAAVEHKSLKELEEFFLSVREQAVGRQEKNTTQVYKELIDNVLRTNVGNTKRERYEIAHNYFIRDFYESPVYYALHLLNFNNAQFVKENVIFEGLDILQEELSKNDTVILNGLHMDLYQILLNYVADQLKNRTISLYGVEASLRKIEKINSLYNPNITNIEYNYLDSLDDKPYPLMFKKAFRDIKENKIIAIPPEVSMGLGPKEKTNLVGLEVVLPQGSALLSHKYSVPVIIVHTVRLENSKIKITFEKPIYPFANKNKQNINKQSKLIFDRISEIVSLYPETWSGYDVLNYLMEGAYHKGEF
ncbi:lipid A biosynthesis acyltransferase [Bacillus sp. V-88]|jgi:lauroyl/myristoyl acyltransferase|nr:hypothetical protein B1B00_16905 [Bacillus sp. DSM 27956]PRX72856.1 lipid A biosynthesis acyltransferase [Bacillus sp. V-88]SLK24207.1 lipid A biosynthesis acyltransferase [Bacillus sp. V-88]